MPDLFTDTPPVHLEPVTSLLATLATLDVTPVNLRIEWRATDQERPQLSMWLRTRTDFDAVTSALRLKTDSTAMPGHRKHWTTADHPAPLIQCASFPHHDDYEETRP